MSAVAEEEGLPKESLERGAASREGAGMNSILPVLPPSSPGWCLPSPAQRGRGGDRWRADQEGQMQVSSRGSKEGSGDHPGPTCRVRRRTGLREVPEEHQQPQKDHTGLGKVPGVAGAAQD